MKFPSWLSSTLPILAVLSAIAYIYASTVFIFIDQWLGLSTSPGIINAAVFTGLAFVCILSFAKAALTDPGRVPEFYRPNIEDLDTSVHEVKRKGGELRYCQKCFRHKPPRAHHCRVCKRCVLRMDHHCIWINNCVGFANYKVFFVFVFHAVIACIYSLVLLSGSLISNVDQNDKPQNGSSFKIAYVFSVLLLLPLIVSLIILLGWHIGLIFQNKTTIEYHEGVRATWLAEKGANAYKHPYDLGPYDNLTMVLGPNIVCWLCPTSGNVSAGLRFRTASNNFPV